MSRSEGHTRTSRLSLVALTSAIIASGACGGNGNESPGAGGATQTSTTAGGSGGQGPSSSSSSGSASSSASSSSSSSASSSSGTPAPPALTARFNFPGGDVEDKALEDTVIDLINHAAPGSTIHISLYHFTRTAPAKALIAAKQQRNVTVRLVLDGSNEGNAAYDLLAPVLGADLVLCHSGSTGSCLGTNINHSKFYLFSELDDGSTNVVVQSSANLTNPMLTDHNNLVIARGDATLYSGYLDYWNDLRVDQAKPDYYTVLDGALPYRAYFFPRASGDTVVSVLDNVDCTSGNKTIRVAMSLFTDGRVEVAQKLVEKKKQGCTLLLLLAERDGSPGASVLSTLTAGDVGYHLVTPTATRSTIHSKVMLIDADYQGGNGVTPRQLVFTGSHNWTGPALTSNDEQMVRIDEPSVYAAFVDNWEKIRTTVP